MKILIVTQRGRTIRLRVWNRLLLNGIGAHALAHAVCKESVQPVKGHKWDQFGGVARSMIPQHRMPEPGRTKQGERRETARLFRRFFRTVRSHAAAVRRAGGDPLVEVKIRSGVQVAVAL